MARIRSIKPEFWDSPGVAQASLRARLLYIAMWNWADDFGIGDGNPKRLIGFAFPNDDISASEVPTLLSEISRRFSVIFYEHEGRPFYYIPTWEQHQRTEKKATQRVPFPGDAKPLSDQADESSADSVGKSADSVGSSPPGTGEQGNRGTGEEGTAPRLTAAQIEALFDEAYSHWPKKVERKEALERFKRAAKTRDPQQLVADIVKFGRAYAASTERRFVPALGVWLNGERWSDELPAAPGAVPGGRVMTVEEIERRRSEVEARVG